MIAILLVRCGSSVYVQKKSCSLTSRGGAVSASGELRNRVAFWSLGISEVVTAKVEAGILNDWYAFVSRGNSGWRRSGSRFTVCFSHGGGSVLAGLQLSGVRGQQISGPASTPGSSLGVDMFKPPPVLFKVTFSWFTFHVHIIEEEFSVKQAVFIF